MIAYATVADFKAYVGEPWDAGTLDDAGLTRLLLRATDDVDEVLGPLRYYEEGTALGRKVDPVNDLDALGRLALARATSAQALHRLYVVEPATAPQAAPAVKSVEGPDFKTTYAEAKPTGPVGMSGSGRFSPELKRELSRLAYLRPTAARGRP